MTDDNTMPGTGCNSASEGVQAPVRYRRFGKLSSSAFYGGSLRAVEGADARGGVPKDACRLLGAGKETSRPLGLAGGKENRRLSAISDAERARCPLAAASKEKAHRPIVVAGGKENARRPLAGAGKETVIRSTVLAGKKNVRRPLAAAGGKENVATLMECAEPPRRASGTVLPQRRLRAALSNITNIAEGIANVANMAATPSKSLAESELALADPDEAHHITKLGSAFIGLRAGTGSTQAPTVGSGSLGASHGSQGGSGQAHTSSAAGQLAPDASLAPHLDDSDAEMGAADDPQLVREYASDVFARLAHEERAATRRQPSRLSRRERATVVDKMMDVHMQYSLKTETLFLAVDIFDRFVAAKGVTASRTMLVAATTLLIASKVEEIYPPEVRDFSFAFGRGCDRDSIITSEIAILNTLRFRVCSPTPAHFLGHYQHVNRSGRRQKQLLQCAAELSLLDGPISQQPPSLVAAAALLATNRLCRRQPAWPLAVERQTGRTEQAIEHFAESIRAMVVGAKACAYPAAQKKLQKMEPWCSTEE